MAQGKPSAPVVAPIKDIDEASRVLAEYAATERDLSAAAAKLADDVAALQAASERAAVPLRDRLAALGKRLDVWATANRSTLLKGDSKTITLAAGKLSWRRGPSSVTIEDEAKLIEFLKKKRKSPFLRNKPSIDRQAIIKDPKGAAALPGVTIVPGAEAFVIAANAVPAVSPTP
ncbi:host-nuclease inhibitor Gam family protein [Azospirillum argentinense]|nr:host-nuclease inhibitor Gam family protein [Azospirillum argentinense]